MGLHSYSLSSSEAASFDSVERRCEAERKAKAGFPRKCECGGKPCLLTYTKNDGMGEKNVGRKYFTCKTREGGGCAMLKWWDDVVMEELDEIKMEKQQMEDTLQYINTDARGEVVDPRMMWLNVQGCQDDVYHLNVSCEVAEEKHEELKLKVEELESLSSQVERSAMAVKEMKILTALVVSVALVAFFILLLK